MIRSGDREIVLKCEPPGEKVRSAHDMHREFSILSKLYGHYPYVPRPLDYCDDTSIIGTRFCVMERLCGVIIRNRLADNGSVNSEQISQQFLRLLDALAELRSIDIHVAGLESFGRPIGYVERQVRGWQERLEKTRTKDMANFGAVTSWLIENLPVDAHRAAVVHNDFKMDNLVWDQDDLSKLVGVLDWEMSTIGDPLMDLGFTLSFWPENSDPPEFRSLRSLPYPPMISRAKAINYYMMRTGHSFERPEFYLCFGLFKRAVIEQLKYFRYTRGQAQDSRFAALNEAVRILRDMCLTVITKGVSASKGE
jgi:aminoglycoside phosphotransferase (APT) family kinase protein